MARSTPSLVIFFVVCLFITPIAFAQSSDDIAALQAQIDEHNKQIAAIDQEIAHYEAQLNQVGAKKKTLQNAISELDLSRKKLTASISSTQNKISSLQLQIQQLSYQISDKTSSIDRDKNALSASLRRLSQTESIPLAQAMLSSSNVSDAWRDIDEHLALEGAINGKIDDLKSQQAALNQAKDQTVEKQTSLQGQKKNLLAQKGSLDATRKTQSDLLSETKSQESTYQQLIREKEAAKANFESALQNLKSQLNYQVNPDQILKAGKGILDWPLDRVRITQYFGNTAFAAAGAYNGKGHNGVDLAASIGTPIKAALNGVVIGTGNTDVVRGCYSFGKWVMIKHPNGINTMYGHLSSIAVSSGDSVSQGDIIGYSGETGYATGPHLHFGVYVTSATQILRLGDATKQSTACANAVMPVAPLSGYLDPMNYLPAL